MIYFQENMLTPHTARVNRNIIILVNQRENSADCKQLGWSDLVVFKNFLQSDMILKDVKSVQKSWSNLKSPARRIFL